MTPTQLSNTELIEKCKKIIDGMGRYAYEQIQLSDLLTRFEKAQKENENSIHRKNIPDEKATKDLAKRYNLDYKSLRYMAIYIESFCSLPNLNPPTTNE